MTMDDSCLGWVETVHLVPPAIGDNSGDADRLVIALKERLRAPSVRIDLGILRQLPAALRRWDYAARCVVFKDSRQWVLAGVADPRSSQFPSGVAVDLGTTRMALALVDLQTGHLLSERSIDNPQGFAGPDVLARIHHADSAGGLSSLQNAVVDALDRTIRQMCDKAAVDPGHVHLISVAGNTSMSHLFMGIEPRWIIREPYIPAVNRPCLLTGGDLGFDFNPNVRIYVFPNAGSYFGGDVVAGILFSGLWKKDEPSLLVDVGTNAEVVCGNRSWLIACAGAAGPALEGGMSTIGMAAAPGAIDRIRIHGGSGRIEARTIDDRPPAGICGSGMIDLAAQLFRNGLIDIRGKLVPGAWGERLVEKDGIRQLIVITSAESAGCQDLVIGQPDLDSLIRSKAAMYTILETLTESVGLTFNDISKIYVAGTFGAVIDPISAITIGMLPDLPLDTFKVIGNSSLGGARMVLMDRETPARVDRIRDRITYLELNVNQAFMNRFSAAKFLPHTDLSRFPSVTPPRLPGSVSGPDSAAY